MTRRDLNFIRQSVSLRTLQAATLVAVLACIGTGTALLTGGGPFGAATISDTLSSASFSAQPTPSSSVAPLPVSDGPALAAANAPGSDIVRYLARDTGAAYSVALVSRRTDVLSDRRQAGLVDTVWIPGTTAAFSAFQLPDGIEYRRVDHRSGESTVIEGSDIRDVIVSPDGSRYVTVRRTASDTSTLSVADVAGGEPRVLLTTRADELSVAWRTNESLSLISRRNDRPGSELSLLDLSGSLTVILKHKENLTARWSPDGRYLIYSYFAPETGVVLWLRSYALGEETSLGVPTSAAKCAWHPTGYAVSCGVPSDPSLTRDVSAEQTATIDDIVTYDFDETSSSLVYAGSKGTLLSVSHPFLSVSGRWLIFTNTFDSRLYSVPLN